MRQYDRQSDGMTPVSIDPELERRWQEALLRRPNDTDAMALAHWNNTYGELLTAYQQAIQAAQKVQEDRAKVAAEQAQQEQRSRLTAIAGIVGILLVVGAIVYWVTRPSEEEVRREERLQSDAACTTYYEKVHRLTLVSKQIDLLKEGEGGWIDLYPYEAPIIGNLDLSPAELEAGKIGQAHVNHESFVYDSTLGVGSSALLERRNGGLVLTLFSNLSGFGALPHEPLQISTITTVAVQGERLSSVCFWQ